MGNLQTGRKISALIVVLILALTTAARQPANSSGDSWQQTLARKKGTVTALWDGIEPFIYKNGEGVLAGVEYEIMESLKSYVKLKYGVELTVHWENAGSFDNIYNQVKSSSRPGIFGWSYYSITPARQKEVQFTLPYMPDVNVLITNNGEPMYASSQEFAARLPTMRAYTQQHTTMEEDVQYLRDQFFPGLSVQYAQQDYDIMKTIAADDHAFGYVPLSVYIVALQKGIKVKRQNVLSSRRQGFAAVMPLQTDWKPLMDEYFSSGVFRMKAGTIITSYLGSEVTDLVFDGGQALPANDSLLDLVSLEKEIVTKRLMDTVVEAQQHRAFRNIMVVLLVSAILLSLVLYSRFRTRQRLNAQLSQQKEQIEQMNQLLKMKILQARMNPHFLFNSLNAIQYFITGNDKKASLQYISRFSAFLRKVINLGDELFINVQDEADLVKEYLWLEHCRFHDKFDYEIVVGPGAKDAAILPLLTLSLVEKALYKGVLNLPAAEKGKLCIEFMTGADKLEVQVSDNGLSREQAHLLDKKKGLVNGEDNMLQRRIELFNAHSNRKISTHTREANVLQEPFRTIATITVPQPLFNHTI
jgi:hypothetical protein